MSTAGALHAAVKSGDLAAIGKLLAENPALANARSPTDPRGTYPLHVAAEAGQAEAARVLLEHGADVSRLDAENESNALAWALRGAEGQWQRFSDATLEDWGRCVELLK